MCWLSQLAKLHGRMLASYHNIDASNFLVVANLCSTKYPYCQLHINPDYMHAISSYVKLNVKHVS